MALSTPSTNDHQTMPEVEKLDSGSGIMFIDGETNSASNTVVIRVMNALLCPGILKPNINTKSSAIGIIETNAVIDYYFDCFINIFD